MKSKQLKYRILFFLLPAIGIGALINCSTPANKEMTYPNDTLAEYWKPALINFDTITSDTRLRKIIYGHELIRNTSKYFGPNGSISKTSNGMNCQNCHLEAGSKPWGNNYGAVASTYPKFRQRSGSVESIAKRVNDCFERSLNGKAIDTIGNEMQSIITYIQWLGKDVTKGIQPKGSGIADLSYLDRAASPNKGRDVYDQKCKSCHGENGKGVPNLNGVGFIYPPLWGEHSYNNGAGLFRLSRFAGFVRDNMPFGQASHQKPALTSEEAWDVAAFVNSRPRPAGNIKKDWPSIKAKPIDHPFGPYSDGFSEVQHKYGPFSPIIAKRKV